VRYAEGRRKVKLQILFDALDVDKNQSLDLNEFAAMLRLNGRKFVSPDVILDVNTPLPPSFVHHLTSCMHCRCSDAGQNRPKPRPKSRLQRVDGLHGATGNCPPVRLPSPAQHSSSAASLSGVRSCFFATCHCDLFCPPLFRRRVWMTPTSIAPSTTC
jgi:hypothetical protein